jgi:hypothetical protein
MDLRTGDILVWRSTNYYDTLGEFTIHIPGLHSGIVLCGRKLAKYSACGPSPSDTYVTFLVDSLFPVEEVLGHVWYRPNGATLHHIKRLTGKEISEKETCCIFEEYIQMEKRPHLHTAYISIVAYFRMGGIAHKTGYKNKRWNLCSVLIGYFLNRFGLLQTYAEENNLLPMDFINLCFYQNEEYKSICIFDKRTYKLEWFFARFLIRMGQLNIEPVYNSIIDKMLSNYDYPRKVRTTPELKAQADEYLVETS